MLTESKLNVSHHYIPLTFNVLHIAVGNFLSPNNFFQFLLLFFLFFLLHIVETNLLSEKICRRGTERPCYKASYIQDSRRRLTFEDARQSCRSEGGELLSIETESEQRLIESFIQKLKVGDGDFWIGLRRRPPHHQTGNNNPGCPSQYYWVDGSKAKYRFSWLFLLLPL
uniref:C-type lectin domain-containing protein n=1 Tax=Poecilia mexicana TaxID=48701 RepID=A0A3B3YX13_9TELE